MVNLPLRLSRALLSYFAVVLPACQVSTPISPSPHPIHEPRIIGDAWFSTYTSHVLAFLHSVDSSSYDLVCSNIKTIEQSNSAAFNVAQQHMYTGPDFNTTSSAYILNASELIHDAWHRENAILGNHYYGEAGELDSLLKQNAFIAQANTYVLTHGHSSLQQRLFDVEKTMKTRWWEHVQVPQPLIYKNP